ncbi:MAG: hypothetical protein ACYSTL_02960 [Planctomycetota bacterium]|jgi:hypothetical protein
MSRISPLLRKGLQHRRLAFALAILAILIMLPALRHGLSVDDMIHRVQLLAPARTSGQLHSSGILPENSHRLSSAANNLYAFLPPERIKRIVDAGHLPWWTYEGCYAAFWRPLTSLTLWADYQLFPDYAALMHAHSIVWFAGLIFLVSILYRKLMGLTWVAGLAALLYVLDENYYTPAAMIAHRNSLLAVFFGLLALLCFHQWREHKWRLGAVLTPVILALSLLSAEAGIATLGYLLAYVLVYERGRWFYRVLAVLPSVIVTVVWRIIYVVLGYGVCAGGLYLDPGQDPLQFTVAAAERAPVLLLGQWLFPPSFIYNFLSDSARIAHWLSAAVFLIILLALLAPLLRRSRLARFYLVGMLLSVIPICATIPWDRNLIFVGIGAMGLTAQFIGGLFIREDWVPASRLWRGGAWLLCALILLAQVVGACVGRVASPILYSNIARTGFARVSSPAVRSDQDLIVVRTHVPIFIAGHAMYCEMEGKPVPQAVRVLAALVPLEITRVDDSTLKLRATAGNLLSCEQRAEVPMHYAYFLRDFNSLVRDEKHPMRPGQRIELSRLCIEVTDVDEDGLPREAVFRFAVSLDDPALRWVQVSREGTNIPFEVPAIGQTVSLKGPY